MMVTYKLSPDLNDLKNKTIICSNGSQIPFDPANTDYQAFLRWCEEGNTPLPASDE